MLQDRDSQKTEWIGRCIEELRSDTWVLPALKQIKEICSLFYEVYFLVRLLHFYPGDHCQCSLLILFCSTFWTVYSLHGPSVGLLSTSCCFTTV